MYLALPLKRHRAMLQAAWLHPALVNTRGVLCALRLAKCWQSGKTFLVEAQHFAMAQNGLIFSAHVENFMYVSNMQSDMCSGLSITLHNTISLV